MMHIPKLVGIALLVSIAHATPLHTIDEPVSADTRAAWNRTFAILGFMISREELQDVIAAEAAIADALHTGSYGSGSAPFLHGMSIRQITLLGLAFEKRERELRIQKADIELSSSSTRDVTKLKERKRLRASIDARQAQDRDRIAAIDSRLAYWKAKAPNNAPEPTP